MVDDSTIISTYCQFSSCFSLYSLCWVFLEFNVRSTVKVVIAFLDVGFFVENDCCRPLSVGRIVISVSSSESKELIFASLRGCLLVVMPSGAPDIIILTLRLSV